MKSTDLIEIMASLANLIIEDLAKEKFSKLNTTIHKKDNVAWPSGVHLRIQCLTYEN